MAKYKTYSSYKGSGVEWLGEVPDGWYSTKMKNVLSTPITDGPHETPEFLDEGVPFVSAEAISKGYIDFNKIRGHISHQDNKKYSQKYSPKLNDVFMIKSGATTGVTAIVDTRVDFNIWSPLAVFRTNTKVMAYYLLNYLRSRNFQKAVELYWTYGTQQNIGMNVLENLHISVPTQKEQKSIANYLDKATTKIDTLIEKQSKLIALLKEKRQAVISSAVTRGLDASVPMKDSGVEWLGEIPEHWKTPSLVQVSKRIGDGLHSTPKYQENTKNYFINGNNLNDGNIVIGKTAKEVSDDEFNKHYVHLSECSVLLSINGTIGRVALYKNEKVILGKSAAYINCNSIIKSRFLLHYLQSSNVSCYFDLEVTGTTIFNLSLNSIRKLKVCIPPLSEQIELDGFCVKTKIRFDSLISKSTQSITLLKEKRTALISAAVTGKIDVREAA